MSNPNALRVLPNWSFSKISINVSLNVSNNKLLDRGIRIINHLTKLNYSDSKKLLQLADGEVKTALVMWRKSIGKKEARVLLSNNLGSLKNIYKT